MPTWEEFLAGNPAQISIWELIINLVIAAILSYILSRIYTRYGSALSNRRVFSRNFIALAMTTTLIITVIKSSLALALGLVGALSIVRFRAAIKEPEELIYLFICIAIGLGLGADQRLITIVAFCIIVFVIYIRAKYSHPKEDKQNLHLTISSHNPVKLELEQIVTVLKDHCTAVDIKRFDETKEILEASFLVEFEEFNQIEKMKKELNQLSDNVKITFIDLERAY